jgi:hypothetical protein
VCEDPEEREISGLAYVGSMMDVIAIWRLFMPTVRVDWDER